MSEHRWNPDEYKANYHDIFGLYIHFLPHILKRTILSGSNFLEIGCGSGKWSALFAMLGFNCYLIDNTEGMFDRVRLNFPQIAKTFFFADIDAPELEGVDNDTFDIVFSEGLYEHWLDKKDRKKYMKRCHEIINDTGQVITMIPYKTGADDEYQFEEEELLQEWAEEYQYVTKLTYINTEKNKIIFLGIIASDIKHYNKKQ